ncbi:ferritin family protein [Bradyrhizobium sp. 83002]|uniref:ferritin-like domain-containing protein n=1 Tax=Bradyrhizobium aeschynomenes TaxID=2734909 RepID=UPI001551E63F|nr:ferritin family protein [Bradyrhizobium aeschynomenes]NPU10984.1 ferritin family protein [Bradyrhizobium aeschynomenes]NPV21639.1 ferritin family protein [Bradyrhizobium aeschynomenes]
MLLSRTLLLNSEPAGNLHSLDEMFALANAMEQEAADRYSEFAEEMQRQGRRDLAKVFADLAAAEREHVDSVVKWSHARTGRAPDASLVRWQPPETFDPIAAAEIERSRLMTPYRALSMAVRNEERAFAFWSYLAAYSDSAEVKTAAEAMAREELGHVATLRKERRRAYHRETDARRASAVSPGDTATAGELEHRLAGLLGEMAAPRRGPQGDRMRELAQEAAMMANDIGDLMRLPAALPQADAPVIAEALADAYLDQAERAAEPGQLDLLQRLAAQAISRLAWLRSLG